MTKLTGYRVTHRDGTVVTHTTDEFDADMKMLDEIMQENPTNSIEVAERLLREKLAKRAAAENK